MRKESNGVWYELDAAGHTATVIPIRGEDSYNNEKYEGDIAIPPYVVDGGDKYVVTAIGEGAFSMCEKLESVILPDSIARIEKGAFEYCSRLTTLRLPENIEYIGISAFGFCGKIASIHIPDKEFEVDRHAFHTCKMPVWNAVRRHIHLVKRCINGITYDLKTTTRLAYVAARGKKYRGRVVVPGAVTFKGETYRVVAVGDGAFYECADLTELIIEDGVEHIGGCALWYCTGLRVLRIPKSVNSIDKYAFEHCPQLEVIEVDESNPCYDSRGDCNALIHSVSNTLLLGGCKTCIPEGIEVIGRHAFYGCERLTAILIPNSVRTIGEEAFWDSGLTSVHIPNGVHEIGDCAFVWCTALCRVEIENEDIAIAQDAFEYCDKLTELIFPNRVVALDKTEE